MNIAVAKIVEITRPARLIAQKTPAWRRNEALLCLQFHTHRRVIMNAGIDDKQTAVMLAGVPCQYSAPTSHQTRLWVIRVESAETATKRRPRVARRVDHALRSSIADVAMCVETF